jgi:hypothetical protein
VAGPGTGEEPEVEEGGGPEIEAASRNPSIVEPQMAAMADGASSGGASGGIMGSGGGMGGGGDGGVGSGEFYDEGKEHEKLKTGKEPAHGFMSSRLVGANRANPITPETGAQQTPATANSIVGADKLVDEVEANKPEEVLGNAEERANQGKGGYTGYEFCGPYDYPARPSGRCDSTLTAIGGWRSKTGEHQSSLWSSRYTEKGPPSKREHYYKYSSKKGGNWKKLSSYDAARTFKKVSAYKEGSRWMAQLTEGTPLRSLMASSLKHKMEDIQMGKKGNEEKMERMYGGSENPQM